MSKKGVEDQHSQTALFAAIYRAIANKDFDNPLHGPDHLAHHFLPAHLKFLIKFKFIRSSVRKKDIKITPGVFEYMVARTAFFDQVFIEALSQKIPQVVLLGAGYDTRSYRFANLNKATKIFELDIATTQARKKKGLKKAQVDIPLNVSFVPVDFNQGSVVDVLDKAGYVLDKTTLFLWEGVSYYLEPGSVDATFELVTNASHPESRIAFDYVISISEETLDQYNGAREFLQTWQKHRQNESFKFAIDDGSAASFLAHRKLKLINHLDTRQIEETYLMDQDNSLIGRTNALFRFALAAPAEKPHA